MPSVLHSYCEDVIPQWIFLPIRYVSIAYSLEYSVLRILCFNDTIPDLGLLEK